MRNKLLSLDSYREVRPIGILNKRMICLRSKLLIFKENTNNSYKYTDNIHRADKNKIVASNMIISNMGGKCSLKRN
jgi:hypothetical protein